MKESAQRYIVEPKDIVFNYECLHDYCGHLCGYLLDHTLESSHEIWDVMKVMIFPDALYRLISDAHVHPLEGMSVHDAYDFYKVKIINNMLYKDQSTISGVLLDQKDIVLDEVRSLSSYLYSQIDEKLDQVANAILHTDKYIALRESLNSNNTKEARDLLYKFYCDTSIPYINVFDKTYPEYWD